MLYIYVPVSYVNVFSPFVWFVWVKIGYRQNPMVDVHEFYKIAIYAFFGLPIIFWRHPHPLFIDSISIYFSMVVKPNFQAHKHRFFGGYNLDLDIPLNLAQCLHLSKHIMNAIRQNTYFFFAQKTVDYNYMATQSGVCVARLFMWIYYPRQYLLPYGYQQFVWIGFRHSYTI